MTAGWVFQGHSSCRYVLWYALMIDRVLDNKCYAYYRFFFSGYYIQLGFWWLRLSTHLFPSLSCNKPGPSTLSALGTFSTLRFFKLGRIYISLFPPLYLFPSVFPAVTWPKPSFLATLKRLTQVPDGQGQSVPRKVRLLGARSLFPRPSCLRINLQPSSWSSCLPDSVKLTAVSISSRGARSWTPGTRRGSFQGHELSSRSDGKVGIHGSS